MPLSPSPYPWENCHFLRSQLFSIPLGGSPAYHPHFEKCLIEHFLSFSVYQGLRNDFKAAMEKVDQEYLAELIKQQVCDVPNKGPYYVIIELKNQSFLIKSCTAYKIFLIKILKAVESNHWKSDHIVF